MADRTVPRAVETDPDATDGGPGETDGAATPPEAGPSVPAHTEPFSDIPTDPTAPRVAWPQLHPEGMAIQTSAGFAPTLINQRDVAATFSLTASYDTGDSKAVVVDLGSHLVEPKSERVVELGSVVDAELLASMVYSGSLQLAAEVQMGEGASTQSVAAPMIYFEPLDAGGLLLRSERNFHAQPHAGDFRGIVAGAERKAELEAVLGHPTNLRLVGDDVFSPESGELVQSSAGA